MIFRAPGLGQSLEFPDEALLQISETHISQSEYSVLPIETRADQNMAESGVIVAETHVSSSYRVKFKREQFLELVEIANPKIIYHRGRMHFFAYDGFVMYTFECQGTDFSQRVLDAIEFSNQPWSE